MVNRSTDTGSGVASGCVDKFFGFGRSLIRNSALALTASAALVGAASAETLLMPSRDARTTAPVVVWGVTTQVQGPGLPLFQAIEAALGQLPIVAEDLGFITPDVHALRHALGYPGMKILQFAFGGDGEHEFLPHTYEREVVVYTGTHDNDTVQGWWAAATERERRYAGTYLACGAHDVHWAMIRAAFNSVAHLAIVPLQDVLGLGSDQRMNTPGTMGPPNWTWRFDWPQVGDEPGRVLGLITAASGRGPFELLCLPC